MMRGALLGAVVTLLLVSVGLFWWQGRAAVEQGAPPPEPLIEEPELPQVPVSDPGDMEGPSPPEATELTREQRRFFRYDRNRDLKISRVEMLSSRTAGFRKLDKDGNNLLTFEEWAHATAGKFDGADANSDRELTPSEFAATAPPPRKKSTCRC